MSRVRELVAYGGIAILAVVFALAFAAYQTATAVAQIAVSVLNQHAGSEDLDPLDFKVFGTLFQLDALVAAVLTLLLIVLALFLAWRLAGSRVRTCPECRSAVPREARICRYCTSDLTAEP